MNKREAKFIMQLPDGYEYQFLMDGKFIAGFKPDTNQILVYEIVGEKLIQRGIDNESKTNI